jgi:hypothetical protein
VGFEGGGFKLSYWDITRKPGGVKNNAMDVSGFRWAEYPPPAARPSTAMLGEDGKEDQAPTFYPFVVVPLLGKISLGFFIDCRPSLPL